MIILRDIQLCGFRFQRIRYHGGAIMWSFLLGKERSSTFHTLEAAIAVAEEGRGTISDDGERTPNHLGFAESEGISRRDWYAGQALAGLCGNPGGPFQANSQSGWGVTNCSLDQVAEESYRIADAMERAR